MTTRDSKAALTFAYGHAFQGAAEQPLCGSSWQPLGITGVTYANNTGLVQLPYDLSCYSCIQIVKADKRLGDR